MNCLFNFVVIFLDVLAFIGYHSTAFQYCTTLTPKRILLAILSNRLSHSPLSALQVN